jgi:hypothetical protein
VRVEELVVEVDDGRNVVVVRAAVPQGTHVGKWPNRLRAAWEDNVLSQPYGGRQRVANGGLGWCRCVAEGGIQFWWLGQQVDAGVGVAAPATERRRRASSRATEGRGGENSLEPLSAGPRADKEGRAEGDAGCPGRRILDPNLWPKWVRADKIGPGRLFGSGHWNAVPPIFLSARTHSERDGRLRRPAF